MCPPVRCCPTPDLQPRDCSGRCRAILSSGSGHTDLEDPVFLEAHTKANSALSEAGLVVSELILDATNQIFAVLRRLVTTCSTVSSHRIT